MVDLAALLGAELVDLARVLGFSEEPWRRDAACREVDLAVFFPARGEPSAPAQAVCAGCAVRVECLECAMAAPQTLTGVWGGTTGRDRRIMRRRSAA